MKIKDAFVKRRSAMNFREDFEMNELDFNMIFELARFSPSIFNTQATRYLVIADKQKQAKLKDLSGRQHKLVTASGVILVLGDKEFLDDANVKQIYTPMLNLKMMSEEEYNTMTKIISQYRQSLDTASLTNQLYTNVFINVGILLSIISILGFDSCPMNAQNTEEVKALFDIPDRYELLFLLPVGKSTEDQRLRGYRHPVSELVKFNKFSYI